MLAAGAMRLLRRGRGAVERARCGGARAARAAACICCWMPALPSPSAGGSGGARRWAIPRQGYAPFFSVRRAPNVAQAVFTYAWHLARSQGTAARLLLGMPAGCVAELARHTLGGSAHAGAAQPALAEAALGTAPRDVARAAGGGGQRAMLHFSGVRGCAGSVCWRPKRARRKVARCCRHPPRDIHRPAKRGGCELSSAEPVRFCLICVPCGAGTAATGSGKI